MATTRALGWRAAPPAPAAHTRRAVPAWAPAQWASRARLASARRAEHGDSPLSLMRLRSGVGAGARRRTRHAPAHHAGGTATHVARRARSQRCGCILRAPARRATCSLPRGVAPGGYRAPLGRAGIDRHGVGRELRPGHRHDRRPQSRARRAPLTARRLPVCGRRGVSIHTGASMKLKLLAGATAAALLTTAAIAQTSSGGTGSGSAGTAGAGTPSVGAPGSAGSNIGGTTPGGSPVGSSGVGTGSTTGMGGSTSGVGTSGGSQRCAVLTGLDRDRCLRDEGLGSAGGTSGSIGSGASGSAGGTLGGNSTGSSSGTLGGGSLGGGGLGTGTGSGTTGGTGGASSTGTGGGR